MGLSTVSWHSAPLWWSDIWTSNWSRRTSKSISTLCFFPLQANRLNYLCFSLPKTEINLRFIIFKGVFLKAIYIYIHTHGKHCLIYTNINAVYLSICQCFIFCNTGGPRATVLHKITWITWNQTKTTDYSQLWDRPHSILMCLHGLFYIYKSIYIYIYTLCLFNLSVIFIFGSQFFVKNLPYFFLSLYFCATVCQRGASVFRQCVNVQSFIWMVYQ